MPKHVFCPAPHGLRYRIAYSVESYKVGFEVQLPSGSIEAPGKAPVFLWDEEQPWIVGYVKWDGCIDWKFDDAGARYQHACNLAELEGLALVLKTCYGLGIECPNWAGA